MEESEGYMPFKWIFIVSLLVVKWMCNYKLQPLLIYIVGLALLYAVNKLTLDVSS